MKVGFQVGRIITEVGSPDFLHAFFSNVSYHLESGRWGDKYPVIMEEMYQGSLPCEKASDAYQSLVSIRERFSKIPANYVIWDIENLELSPPEDYWIRNNKATDLSNYFITSGGKNIFDVLFESIKALEEEGGILTIEQIQAE